MKITLLISLIFLLTSCGRNKENDENKVDERLKAIEEIKKAESDFAALADSIGADSAFYLFADKDAVLNRGESIVKGRDSILTYFASRNYSEVKLKWTPEFVDASASGDLGYSYGPYTFTANDTFGKKVESKGIFHTVWKKQTDGSWKFVWD